MKNKKGIDDLIKQSLSEDEKIFYDKLEEQTMFETLYSMFKGKDKRFFYVLLFFSIILFCLTIFTLIKFLNAEIVENIVKWGVATLASFFVLAFLDFYYFIQINKNISLREMKKMELKIMILSNKIEKITNN